ncbi:MAG: Zn-dependent peptidase ImmA, family [Frankiales bacterium]|nr:Zn-dependent peptidase ImmA, family [Frankiales bacterium]
MLTNTRITLARHRRGLTITQLATDIGVARQTLAAWEVGDQVPTDLNLLHLAASLQFPPSFFSASDIEPVPVGAVSFRALSKMTATTRDIALAAGRISLLINEWFEGRYRLPGPDVPTLGRQSPEQAADVVRQRWGLGNAPIGNLTHVLESHGVRIFSLPVECKTVDAFSFRWFDTPLVLLTTGKTAERRRFDLAHELGHLVLHTEHEGFQGPEAEAQANRFASSFLMPRAALMARPLRSATLDAILSERRRWKVAAMALTYRLRDLGFLTEWEYRNHCVELSRRGFRSSEPGGGTAEASQVLGKIFQLMRGKDIGIGDIASDLGLTSVEVTQHLLELVVLPLQSHIEPGEPTNSNPTPGLQQRHLRLA